jgi:hypothetical protein
VGERDSDYVTAMADWELAEYRKSLEDALAQAEVPKYYLPPNSCKSSCQPSWRSRTREGAENARP